ncbi:MAG: carotenoid oxygenase family protein [Myxococcota bacterium]
MPLPKTLSTSEHTDLDLKLVEGQWPDGISGEFVVVAPGPKTDEIAYQLFTEGHTIRLSLRAGTDGAASDRFAWRARKIRNPSVRLFEQCRDACAAGPAGYSSPFGMLNMANTAVMPWGDRLLATWDVGRPVELDPVSLEFLAEAGSKRSWGQSIPVPGILPFIFSTAHPVVDPDRDCLWTVKLSPSADHPGHVETTVVRWDGVSTEVRTWPVTGAHFSGTMHTITQTRNWLILADSGNFKPDPGEMGGGERTVLIDYESPVFLVRKDDLESTPSGQPVPMKKFMIAPPTAHLYAVYDDADGIRVIFENMDLEDLAIYHKPGDVDVFGERIDPSQIGLYNMAMAPSSFTELEFDVENGKLHGRAKLREDWTWSKQLSAMDWSPAGLSAPTVHHQLVHGWRPHNVSRRALEIYKDRVDPDELPSEETPATLFSMNRGDLEVRSRYDYPTTDGMPTSPIFVPRNPGRDRFGLEGSDPGGHDGWVVVPVLADSGLQIDVFDADAVGKGPVARLAAPAGETVPLLLHSCWMPRAVPAPEVQRLRFGDDFEDSDLALLDDGLKDAVHAVARDLDEGG